MTATQHVHVYHRHCYTSRLPCRDTRMQTKLFYTYLLSLHVYIGGHVCCCCVKYPPKA